MQVRSAKTSNIAIYKDFSCHALPRISIVYRNSLDYDNVIDSYTLKKRVFQWFIRMVKGSTSNLLLSGPG